MNANHPFLSIIIPVYNAAPYLSELFNSILTQSMKNFELIVVNDCSNDDSDKIIRSYMHNEGRIVYVNKKLNEGVDACRRDGLALARGEYILFCDADDSYEPTLFSQLLGVTQENHGVKIIEFGFCDVKNGIKQKTCYFKRRKPNTIYAVKNENIMLATALWNKCYQREFVLQYRFSGMPSRCQGGGEIPFHICSFLKAKQVYFLDFCGYNRRIVKNSLSHDSSKDTLFFSDTFDVLKFLKSELERLDIFDEKKYYEYCTTILNWYVVEKFSLHKSYLLYYATCRDLFKRWNTKNLLPFWIFAFKQFKKAIKRIYHS